MTHPDLARELEELLPCGSGRECYPNHPQANGDHLSAYHDSGCPVQCRPAILAYVQRKLDEAKLDTVARIALAIQREACGAMHKIVQNALRESES